jgi:hypothetical protein
VKAFFTPATSFRWAVTISVVAALLSRSWACGVAVIALCIYGVVRFDGCSEATSEQRRFNPNRAVTGRWRFVINAFLHGDLAALVLVALVFRAPALGLSCLGAVVCMLIAIWLKEKVLSGTKRGS